MVISKKDMELLKEIELYLFNQNNINIIDNQFFTIENKKIKDIKALNLYFKLYNMIEKLENKRISTNVKNWERINNKRQIDPSYARSEKEKK